MKENEQSLEFNQGSIAVLSYRTFLHVSGKSTMASKSVSPNFVVD